MRLTSLSIKNLRGLERVVLAPGPGLNVIAGPNAVGKTTILEAVRLAKSLLAQRFGGEAQQVLNSLGGNPNPSLGANAQLASLANNPSISVEIDMALELDDEEMTQVKSSSSALALMNLQTQLARSLNESSLDLAQYLSTVEGQARMQESQKAIEAILKNLPNPAKPRLALTIDVSSAQVRGADATAQTLVTFLERSLTPNLTHFNYFTADRALPAGEVQIQLGTGDVQQQVQSYMAVPASKYARVKQLIVQTLLLDENGRQRLTDEFNLIFDNLLPGKRLAGVQFNEHGILRVLVQDLATLKVFDIDSMSSGEKGLVLTFLTLRLSSKNNSIVLLDEPELHLNAAVCSRITPFIIKYCVEEKGLQIIICSHSPEIIRDAFEREDCKLFHLRSSTDLSPVLQQDSGEVFEIMSRLGASTADVLFSRGTIFVEGEHDALILQAGYQAALQGYKVQPLGGRIEVEREIIRLQENEKQGRLNKRQLFIFDRDRLISGLKSSNHVRVQQLQRYCIENYLLDEIVLYDIILANSSKFLESRGTFPQQLEDIALSQLNQFVVTEVYKPLEPENAGIRSKEIKNTSFAESAAALWTRIDSVRNSVSALDGATWQSTFIQACEAKRAELEPIWKTDWKTLASGKQIIDDLYARYEITMKKAEFKKKVITALADKETDAWRVLDSILTKELS